MHLDYTTFFLSSPSFPPPTLCSLSHPLFAFSLFRKTPNHQKPNRRRFSRPRGSPSSPTPRLTRVSGIMNEPFFLFLSPENEENGGKTLTVLLSPSFLSFPLLLQAAAPSRPSASTTTTRRSPTRDTPCSASPPTRPRPRYDGVFFFPLHFHDSGFFLFFVFRFCSTSSLPLPLSLPLLSTRPTGAPSTLSSTTSSATAPSTPSRSWAGPRPAAAS